MIKPRLYLFLLLTFVTSMASANPQRILVMGDSLSAGYGMELKQAWVSLLQQQLTTSSQWQIINASVSGETSTGGKARLPALLKQHQPDIVILELGGNDGLRGQPLKILRQNLQAMIDMSRATNARVVLVGMQIPPNYGPRYTREFAAIYPDLAHQNQLPLVPFLLEGVAGDPELMQNDGLHAQAKAQPVLLHNVWQILQPLLESAAQNSNSKP